MRRPRPGGLTVRWAATGGGLWLVYWLLRVRRAGATREQHDRRARLRSSHRVTPGAAGDLLLVGDQLVADGDWSSLLPGRPIRNRGLDGDTTADVLDRLPEVLDPPPNAVVLQVGTNDLAQQTAHAQIARNYQEILDTVLREVPDALVVAVGVPPRRDRFNSVVPKLNFAVERLCAQRGLRYVDLPAVVADGDGRLDAPLTDDGVHLSGEAYSRWAELLAAALDA